MNSNVSIPHPKNDQYEYYPLDTNAGYALLAEDHEIVVTPETGQIILVNWERRHLVTNRLFTTQERAVLMTLLEHGPPMYPQTNCLRGYAAVRHTNSRSRNTTTCRSAICARSSRAVRSGYIPWAWRSFRWVNRAFFWSVFTSREERSRQTLMRIKATHLRALLHVKGMIEQMKAMKQMPLTQREREVLDESLERAYDRAAFLLTPQVMQMLVDDKAATEREDADVSRVSFP